MSVSSEVSHCASMCSEETKFNVKSIQCNAANPILMQPIRRSGLSYSVKRSQKRSFSAVPYIVGKVQVVHEKTNGYTLHQKITVKKLVQRNKVKIKVNRKPICHQQQRKHRQTN